MVPQNRYGLLAVRRASNGPQIYYEESLGGDIVSVAIFHAECGEFQHQGADFTCMSFKRDIKVILLPGPTACQIRYFW